VQRKPKPRCFRADQERFRADQDPAALPRGVAEPRGARQHPDHRQERDRADWCGRGGARRPALELACPNGRPVYNFRSEGRDFGRGRCLIVADGFYEFTDAAVGPDGKKPRKKQKWLFTMRGEPWFCFAGIWRTHPEVGEAYTMLTTAPGPDMQPYHDRQVVVLGRSDWATWLDPAADIEPLLRPPPAGTLEVTRVAGVNESPAT
jgi:putative SOS response-associated peptidase YedK